MHRDIAAALGVIGDPDNVDLENAILTARFNDGLPPPPYPFNVNRKAASRGEILFEQACAGCHAAGNEAIHPPSVTGTHAGLLFNGGIDWQAGAQKLWDLLEYLKTL